VAHDVTLLSSDAPAPLERYLFEYPLTGLRRARAFIDCVVAPQAKRVVRAFNGSMYPIRNDPEHDKDRSKHPCDQSQISSSENNALANEIVIEHRRPSDHLFVRLPVCPHGNSDYSKACDDREHDVCPPFRERMNLRAPL
jgi:hypothetical protein